ncbi:PSME3-interacting protein [Coccinella septempunctata]|uniref:PSME3-interacting protein n=1 Tax=Coccinella septempunctata TaxID=41139 RepID=UPI001D08D11F|nr:PSME3-interacting protein [Coccinella septempunctata]
MSSGFVTESEIEEARRKRQEEWEKVRKPTDPLEMPEEPYDSRSLFDRLQEQKQKKELEYEEAHKLKNMIKGLDDDEIEFLDLVDRTKIAADRKKELEEEKELSDFRNRVAVLQEKTLDEKISEEKIIGKAKAHQKTIVSQQQKLLKGAIVTKKRKLSDNDQNNDISSNEDREKEKLNNGEPISKIKIIAPPSGLQCIGVLPGMGSYSESSDSSGSDSEIEPLPPQIDLVGRQIKKDEPES